MSAGEHMGKAGEAVNYYVTCLGIRIITIVR